LGVVVDDLWREDVGFDIFRAVAHGSRDTHRFFQFHVYAKEFSQPIGAIDHRLQREVVGRCSAILDGRELLDARQLAYDGILERLYQGLVIESTGDLRMGKVALQREIMPVTVVSGFEHERVEGILAL